MSAPGKPTSRWGTFLSSAVTGMESRLDNMLDGIEGEEQGKPQQTQQPQQQAPMSAAGAKSPPPGSAAAKASTANSISRSSSNNRANDRLQARLAKAMAGKSQGGADAKGVSPRSSIDSRNSADRPSIDALNGEKKEEESTATAKKAEEPAVTAAPADEAAPSPSAEVAAADKDEPAAPEEKAVEEEEAPRVSTSEKKPDPEPQAEPADEPKPDAQEPSPQPTIPQVQEPEVSGSSQDVEELKARHQEEIQEFVERIDSLQSKLQYLSKNAADTAKKNKSAAASGSADRKLAERDEKIALLMEEGQKLSSAEGKFRMTIKRLRQQIADNEKQAEELQKGKDKALADADALRNRLDGSEEKEKQEEKARKATASLQKEIDALKKDKAAKDEAMRKLEQDLKAKTEKAEAASTEAHGKALATEREKQRELEGTIETLKAERDSISDKARLEGLEWKEKLERATERNANMETEMKTEIKSLEAKLEAMRSVAEDASSGSGNDAQVKLIRQIETLQSQYATASDNWQGIEASLLTKVANLEKERDEAQRRESEMRKKARDAASRCRQLEDELQDIQPELTTTKQELESCREQLSNLRSSSKATETALEQARADLDKHQRASAREFQDSERRQWRDETPGPSSRNQSRPASPMLPISRTFSSEFGFQPPGKSSRRTPVGSIPDSPMEGSRRMSSQPPQRSNTLSPSNSGLPPAPFSPFESLSESPNLASPSLAGRDDMAEEAVAPSSPRNMTQDMISVSTVGAGPSVQLVDRLSAAVRRLEGEKVAAKEEMTRVCSQRDEARNDIVGLMKEVEAAKAATDKVEDLEKELKDINARYQTTLEMLGEKSELVEELKADVQDVKDMYRELVERTVK